MSQMSNILLILSLIIILAVLVQSYNGLIGLRNQLERAWANIDVVLKQRFDEIPQVLQVVEQFANFEAGIIKKVVEARAQYGSARNVSDKIEASNEMSLALKGLFALGEAYPDLQSSQNFRELQTRVSSLETTLSDRREVYNEAVANFNTRIDQLPDVFMARILNYQRQQMFKIGESERQMPSLKMNIIK